MQSYESHNCKFTSLEQKQIIFVMVEIELRAHFLFGDLDPYYIQWQP